MAEGDGGGEGDIPDPPCTPLVCLLDDDDDDDDNGGSAGGGGGR